MKFSITLYVMGAITIGLGLFVYQEKMNDHHDTLLSSAVNVSKATGEQPNALTAAHESATSDGGLDAGVKTQITGLSQEVRQLRAEVTSLRAALQAQAQAVNGNAVTVAEALSPAEAKKQHDEMRAKEDEQLAQQNQALEADFRKQRADARWASKTQAIIKQALEADQVAAADILGIECRSTMCRVELSNENKDKSKMMQFAMQVGAELPNILASPTSDSTILYLSKGEGSGS